MKTEPKYTHVSYNGSRDDDMYEGQIKNSRQFQDMYPDLRGAEFGNLGCLSLVINSLKQTKNMMNIRMNTKENKPVYFLTNTKTVNG